KAFSHPFAQIFPIAKSPSNKRGGNVTVGQDLLRGDATKELSATRDTVPLAGCELRHNGDMIRASTWDHSQTGRIPAVPDRREFCRKWTLFQTILRQTEDRCSLVGSHKTA